MTPVPSALVVAAFRAQTTITSLVAAPQIGTQLHGTYPAIRVTQMPSGPHPVTATSAPEVQWEVWGPGPEAEWPTAQTGQAIDDAIESGALVGTYSLGRILGAWIVVSAFSAADETTSRPRYMGTVGVLAQ